MLDDPLDQRCLRGITVNVELADAAEIAAARRARRGNSRPAAQSTALLRQIEPDMQLAQLLGRDLGRRTHHQILGALVHRKEYDFAQVLFPAEQHHDAVDAGRDAAVGRRAERKRTPPPPHPPLPRPLPPARPPPPPPHPAPPLTAAPPAAQLDAVA